MTPENYDLDLLRGDDDFQKRLGKKNKREKRREKNNTFNRRKRGVLPEAPIAPGQTSSGEIGDTFTVEPIPLEVSDLQLGFARALATQLQKIGVDPDPDRLDQHFLIDEPTIDAIAQSAEISANDSILEIGPGPGNLTRKLWEICRSVRASLSTIEIDRRFQPLLRDLPDAEHIHMFWADAITAFPQVARSQRINKLVANIPYSILEPLLMALHAQHTVRSATLLVGKRYADRAMVDFHDEDPAGDRFSKTSLFSQARFQPKVVMEVPRERFLPPPNTESAVLTLHERKGKNIDLLTVANYLVKRPTFRVRSLLQNLLQQKERMQDLRKIRTAEDARELASCRGPQVNELGLSDALLNSSLTSLSNDQLQNLLLRMDLVRKRKNADQCE